MIQFLMRLFVANWKMNMTRAEARAYTDELGGIIGERTPAVELVLAPPYTCFEAVRDPRERWSLAGQDVAAESRGAFTGEVSARMLADAGCRYVIVGHSERRRLFGEGTAVLAKKLERTREERLIPIYCVGETEEERQEGIGPEILRDQLATLDEDPPDAPLVVAYEPVWAIGTGRAASPEDAKSARRVLLDSLSDRRDLRILYGGSVTAQNAEAMLDGSGMDGFLIGGASLKAAEFAAIAGLARDGRTGRRGDGETG